MTGTTTHPTITAVKDSAHLLRAEHRTSDELGRLTDKAAQLLRESGGIRLLQAADHGGYEADPRVFFEWVRTVAQHNPSAGWVAGVVGVHPWELALVDPRLHDEIYATDVDTWVASPYAPNGRAVPVDGGLQLHGEWTYSTGTDFCDWIILGGLVADPSGTRSPDGPPDHRHFVLPRTDYEIVDDSWHVMGLEGTGSKTIRVNGAVVPEYRTIAHIPLCEGAYNERRAGSPLYQLPFGCIFSAAIASATFGIARGAIDAYYEYIPTRVSVFGVVGKTDPFQQQALAEAEADLASGIAHVDQMIGEWLDRIAAGETISAADRLAFRRNQVRAVQRVLFSVDALMSRAGSAAIWSTRPLERYWRDLRTAGTHVCNVMDTIYLAWASHTLQSGTMPNTFF
jgi:3-hydroxy-9,10-secoandrosta-1,3,5(10)-triene-9,17-dione monooxygenase